MSVKLEIDCGGFPASLEFTTAEEMENFFTGFSSEKSASVTILDVEKTLISKLMDSLNNSDLQSVDVYSKALQRILTSQNI